MKSNKKPNNEKSQSRQGKYRDRIDLGKTSSKCDLKQLICFIGFVIAVIIDLGLIQLFFSIQDILQWYLRIIIAVPVIIIAFRITQKSMKIVYGEIRNPPRVIKKGPFRYSRHPMYLSAILLYLSIDIASFSIIGFIYSMGVIALYSYFAQFEERHLIIEFGKEYKDYMNQVSRWIGFPKK